MSDKKPYAYLCGTPAIACSGSSGPLNAGMGGSKKLHPSSEAAFKCHAKHLIDSGYTQLDSRAFAPPDGGPVRILTKKSRFGARLRNGKEGTRNMALRAGRGKGTRSGTITSM